MNVTEIKYQPIGVIHTAFKQPSDTPVQAAGAMGAKGTIEIHPEFQEGLLDLEGFSHLHLVYHFHRVGPTRLAVTPFLDTQSHGVFATRAPARPNAIGVSVVRLLSISGATLQVEDVDILDGTPLLDVKPFVPKFDHREPVRIGWFGGKLTGLDEKKADSRFLNQGR